MFTQYKAQGSLKAKGYRVKLYQRKQQQDNRENYTANSRLEDVNT